MRKVQGSAKEKIIWNFCYDEDDFDKDEYCAVEQFFKDQEKLPLSKRTNYFMISCKCRKCTKYTL